jgi:glyoxylase-like metal-dependent hydrolase (beta-lactamase superfamily II)
MRHPALHILVTSAIALAFACGVASAHSGAHSAADEKQPAPTFKVEKVGEHVWALFGRGGNVGFIVTDAGVAVVDDQYRDMAQGIIDEIRKVTDKPIRFLINTHYHGDHTGGNPVFQPISEIVAHESVRPRLLEFPLVVQKTFPGKVQALEAEIAGLKDPADPYRDALTKDVGIMKFMLDTFKDFNAATAAPPAITFDTRMTLWLADQPVEIVHIAPGHTDGDSMVYFPREKVLHVGDLMFNGMVPFIDVEGGGSGLGYIKNLDWVLDHMPSDTKIIPGHGPVTDMTGLRRFRDFLKELDLAVEKAVKKGLSRAEAARTVKLEAYTDMKQEFRSLANDVLVFYDETRARK